MSAPEREPVSAPAGGPSGDRAADQDVDPDAAERLRRRYPPPRTPRSVAIGAVAVLAAVFVGWVVWAGIVHASPAVSGQILRWAVDSDTQVSFTLTVDRPDPSVPATCRVIAQATNFERVGSLDVPVAADARTLVDLTGTMKTFRRATSVSVDTCWAG